VTGIKAYNDNKTLHKIKTRGQSNLAKATWHMSRMGKVSLTLPQAGRLGPPSNTMHLGSPSFHPNKTLIRSAFSHSVAA